MKTRLIFAGMLSMILLCAACGRKPAEGTTGETTAKTPQVEAGTDTSPAAKAGAPDAVLEGKVVFVKDGGGYTYVEIEKDGKKSWAAGPKVVLKVGDTVKTMPGSIMRDFASKTLDRTFDSILFTGGFMVNGQAPRMAGPHGAMGMMGKKKKAAVAGPKAGAIKAAAGGYTVAQIFEKSQALKGQQVSVRGKVVKVNGPIMDVYWYHIQDGTGEAPHNDLVATSADGKVKAGAVVLLKAKLTTDKDLGAGYTYEVILEEAELTVEQTAVKP